MLRVQSDAGIGHTDQDLLRIVPLRFDQQLSRPIADRAHGFNAIHDQVQNYLLQLDAIPRTDGRLAAKSVRSETRRRRASFCARAIVSWMTSLISNGSLFVAVRFKRARILAMTSLARLPSRMMRCAASLASSRSGCERASHRMQALPLVTTAASGWLISCAIDAANSPWSSRG